MATRIVLTALCTVLAYPFVIFSRIAVFCNLWNLESDVAVCLDTIDNTLDDLIPKPLMCALVVAEDKRNAFHPGIDMIGIARAVWVRLKTGKLQGASTIEQQFVRVVSNRYEVTYFRKMREQILAVEVSRRRRKLHIGSAYLAVAYYGYGLIGRAGLRKFCGSDLEICSSMAICEAIARLKYPEPSKSTPIRNEKIRNRVHYILHGLKTQNEIFESEDSSVLSHRKKLDRRMNFGQ